MFGVRNWLTPMHSTSALALSICLARFSLICAGISLLRGRSTAAKHHPPCPRTRNLVGDRNPREHEVVVQRRSFDSGKSGANQAAVTATLVLSRIGGAEGDRTPRWPKRHGTCRILTAYSGVGFALVSDPHKVATAV